MRYFMPVDVYEENDCIKTHADCWTKFGKKALVVTGSHSAFKNGAYKDLEEVAHTKGVDLVLFKEVEENPSVDTVMKARDFGLAEKVDFVIPVAFATSESFIPLESLNLQ